MQPWLSFVLIVCAVALTIALIVVIVALVRVIRRADTVLGIVEDELRPLIGQGHSLADELCRFTREAGLEVKRLGEATERINAVADGVARVVSALASLTRAGQMVGLAAGLKRGIEVFVRRFRKEGESHE